MSIALVRRPRGLDKRHKEISLSPNIKAISSYYAPGEKMPGIGVVSGGATIISYQRTTDGESQEFAKETHFLKDGKSADYSTYYAGGNAVATGAFGAQIKAAAKADIASTPGDKSLMAEKMNEGFFQIREERPTIDGFEDAVAQHEKFFRLYGLKLKNPSLG